jgi:hypothetical protein
MRVTEVSQKRASTSGGYAFIPRRGPTALPHVRVNRLARAYGASVFASWALRRTEALRVELWTAGAHFRSDG